MGRPRIQEPSKTCQYCGTPLARKRYGKQLEDMGCFVRRMFCSLSCANSRRDKTVAGYRAEAYRIPKAKMCEMCGSKLNLHHHHRDQDIRNNATANLQTLCASCHLKLHWREIGFKKRQYRCSRQELKDGLQDSEGLATPSSRKSRAKSSHPSSSQPPTPTNP